MLAFTKLALAGLAVGSLVIEERDWSDGFDDSGLLLVGAIAVVWYLVGGNRFKRTILPINPGGPRRSRPVLWSAPGAQ